MTLRIVSGMRPTGDLHIGHLRGVLQNWRDLQQDGNTCFFFIADWHALTTDYADANNLSAHARRMASAWLAAGISPERAIIFRQSAVPAHAELFVLLSMLCPLPWLFHMPTYKEQKENMLQNLDTYGFLGYPLLQGADIMIYGADAVPVGEDQLPHIEFTRDIARRFNRMYGDTESFAKRRAAAGKKIGKDADEKLRRQKSAFAESGDATALETAAAALDSMKLDESDKRILREDLYFGGEEILRAPKPLLTPAPRLPGTDGRKMSKSYNNTIDLFDPPKIVSEKIARMQTDPQRIRRSDPGDPKQCPVWKLHEIFSDNETQQWAQEGCRSAGIGCIDCKKRLASFINDELAPILERRETNKNDSTIDDILAAGGKRAAQEAEKTMSAVRTAMQLQT